MEPGQHADEAEPVAGRQVAAAQFGGAVDVREDGDGVPVTQRVERLAVGGGHRRDGEFQPGLAGGAIPDDELREAIDASYDAVVAKLPKKARPPTS